MTRKFKKGDLVTVTSKYVNKGYPPFNNKYYTVVGYEHHVGSAIILSRATNGHSLFDTAIYDENGNYQERYTILQDCHVIIPDEWVEFYINKLDELGNYVIKNFLLK